MANYVLKKPIVFTDGTGFDIEPNDEIYALTNRTITFAIGQSVASSSNVFFNQVSGSEVVIDDGTLILKDNQISGSFTHTGDFTTSDNLTINGTTTISSLIIGSTINGNWVVDGTITAEKIESELTQSATLYDSGSTLFGDTLDDNHNFTGSLLVSGSVYLNANQITEISNDILLGDSNPLSSVSENAIKTYVDNNTNDFQTYSRKSFAYIGSVVNESTASFTAVTASAPTGYTTTSVSDFMFFLNGMFMESDSLVIEQNGLSLLLKVDNATIGYNLETADEVVAFGKFNS